LRPIGPRGAAAERPTLSVLVPARDEEATLAVVVEELLARLRPAFAVEVIVVDDGSRDGTPKLIEELCARFPELRALRHPRPRGKGAAVRSAIAEAHGEVLLIQDADLEYQPRDIPALLQPILDGHADAVYGSRFTGPERAVNFFWHTQANRLVTGLANLLFDANFTDVYTGYKAMRASFVQPLRLVEPGFAIEIELTAKLRRSGARFYEVPIRYRARTYAEGKKIQLRDALAAFAAVLRHRFSRLE
jgi:glycosyltransferase involved in cell wall biosynthesis